MQKKLLFVVNVDWFFVSHWLPLARAAKLAGYEVHVATTPTDKADASLTAEFTCHNLTIDRSGVNPFSELKSAYAIYQLLKQVKPDIVHLMTIKPILYGGLAARLARVPAVVVGVTGLGFVFISNKTHVKLLRYLVVQFYKLAFNHKNIFVTFENESDKAYFLQEKLVNESQVSVVNGAGVDLDVFHYTTERTDKTIITFAGRLLRDKGFFELIAAANIIKSSYGDRVEFWIVGLPDPVNPASITQAELDKLHAEKIVTFLGFQPNIADIFSKSNVVVLPSYREGLPKVLIEAAACGRAVITTDVPGCRHAIIPNVTGLLVPPKQVAPLVEAISRVIENVDFRLQLGLKGRELAEQRFAVDKISADYIYMYNKLLSRITE